MVKSSIQLEGSLLMLSMSSIGYHALWNINGSAYEVEIKDQVSVT